MISRAFMATMTLLASACPALAADPAPKLSAADYETLQIRNWTVHVEKSLAGHPRRQQALDLLTRKLTEVEHLVPAGALPKLRAVDIWLSRQVAPGACYHPSRAWLEAHGRVVEMQRCIELQNIDHFIDWADTQPQMVLHELAHAWHDREIAQGYHNPEILTAYAAAVASGKYAKVRHHDGGETRHYGLNDAMEFFAEASEAYFGRNDFQPFDRAELKAFDPTAYAMVEKMWRTGD
jgi:dipeptidyl-peptidase-4